MSKQRLFITGYFILAILLQVIAGNIPLSYFAFPLNVIFAAIWLFLLWKLYIESQKSSITTFLISSKTSILCIILIIIGSLVIGLFPQLSDIEAQLRTDIPALLGCYNFMTSWIFIAILFLFLSNLGLVIIHAFYHRIQSKRRFLLNHIGLWLALFAGFVGSADMQTLRIPLYTGTPAREAYDMSGVAYYLDYELELKKFEVEYYPNGIPSRFTANVRIEDEQRILEVNHPYSYRLGEDIYLTGYDVQNTANSRYCVLQVVRQPWKYIIVAGILMMLAGAFLLFINGSKHIRS